MVGGFLISAIEAFSFGRQYNDDKVFFFNDQCETLGAMELGNGKTIRAIDSDNSLLYYSYSHDYYDRIGIKKLDIEWFQ